MMARLAAAALQPSAPFDPGEQAGPCLETPSLQPQELAGPCLETKRMEMFVRPFYPWPQGPRAPLS